MAVALHFDRSVVERVAVDPKPSSVAAHSIKVGSAPSWIPKCSRTERIASKFLRYVAHEFSSLCLIEKTLDNAEKLTR